jgi:hypothetical protein
LPSLSVFWIAPLGESLARAREDDEAQVNRVLAADHSVEKWNYRDKILRTAARRWNRARHTEALRGWIAARLKKKLPADQWRAEFAGVESRWPLAVPFPSLAKIG